MYKSINKSTYKSINVSNVSFFVHWKRIFFLPTFKEFGVNSNYKYASTTRLKSKTFALQYLGQKSPKLSQKPLVRNLISLSLAVAIFWSAAKQLCIWTLELSEHYEPGNESKNQRLKPLRKSMHVSREIWRARFLDMVYVTAATQLIPW